jgi:NADPH:quinone reductase-like Zn-dependent oxidoreductase
MKSWHINLGAGLAGLTLEEHPEPQPGPHEVLVRVRAVSLNYRELMIAVQGWYPLPVKPDVVAVSDGAGEVVAIGAEVTRVRMGDRVVASIFPRWIDGAFGFETAAQLGGSLDGMLTELAVLPEECLLAVPPHLSFEEAATLPCAGVTAWNALTGGCGLRAGETVLTIGAGSVSLFALQFARMSGARVIALTSSDEKTGVLRSLGASDVVNYRTNPDWPAEVRRLTDGIGVDHVVEVGGYGTLERSFRSTALGGEMAWVGNLVDGPATIDATVLRTALLTMRMIAVGSRAQFSAMNRAIAVAGHHPRIDRVFSFAEAHEAFAYYAAGKAFGKVVIKIG